MNWIFDRCAGRGEAEESPIGWVPADGAITTEGLNISEEDLAEVMAVDPSEWEREVPLIEEYYRTYGDRTPPALYAELEALSGAGSCGRQVAPFGRIPELL